jgi:biotin carboxylase
MWPHERNEQIDPGIRLMIDAKATQPVLAVMFDAQVLAFQLVEAARSRWRILWLVDQALGDVRHSMRSLNRLGTVIDVTGLSDIECPERVREYEPAGVIAFGEHLLMRASVIGHQLGLASNSAHTIACYTDKYVQREALRAGGVQVPGYWLVPEDLDRQGVAQLSVPMHFPLVVKPKAGNGSRDTYRVDNADELWNVIENQARRATVGQMIIEEYLADRWAREERPDADFVSVESLVCENRPNHLAITGRARLAEPFRETGNFLPADLAPDVQENVLALASQAIAALGTRTGAVHTEIKLTPDGPRVIEVNGRIGGTIPELLLLSGGHSILELASRAALGEQLNCETMLSSEQIGYTYVGVPPMNASRLVTLEGIRALKEIPGVRQVALERQDGDRVDWRDGFGGRLYIVYGTAQSYPEMWAARNRVEATIKATFE